MNALIALLRAVWPYALCLAVGFGAAWSWQGSRADARVLTIQNEHQKELLDQADTWRKEVLRRQALADDIDRKAAARDRELTTKLQETQHALTTATHGRPCLGGAALRVLDQATGLRPPESASPLHGRPATAAAHSEIGADDEEVATDTDVAGWIAIAGDYYERCRARIRDIRHYENGAAE